MVKFLQYITSRDRIPPLGLECKIEVDFFDSNNPTFFADTCSYVLRVLRVHTSIDAFQAKLFEASDKYLGLGALLGFIIMNKLKLYNQHYSTNKHLSSSLTIEKN